MPGIATYGEEQAFAAKAYMASVKRFIGQWVNTVAEIEADTKAVSNILVSCR